VERSAADLHRDGCHRGRATAVDLVPVRIAGRLGYRKSHHQIAKPVAATMAVMAIEINSERTVSLIQSATDPHFQSAPWPGVSVVSLFFVKR
jgi:hypothetical protein